MLKAGTFPALKRIKRKGNKDEKSKSNYRS